MRGAPSLAPGAASSRWHSRCGLTQHQQCRKMVLCPVPCTAARPESGRGPCHYLNIFPLLLWVYKECGKPYRRNDRGLLVKCMEWQEGCDTAGTSSAVNKEKLHFHINDILEKGNRQERQRKEGIFLRGFELPEEARPFKDVARKRKHHRIFCKLSYRVHCAAVCSPEAI